MIGRDMLWKGILEDLADDMLRFFFPKYADEIDFARGFEFLDKELEQLMPVSAAPMRHADKLLKGWLLNGAEHWFLIHVEVQGYPDPEFPKRMFQSYYRIQDRYDHPLTALAVYTDKHRKHHKSQFTQSFMGTEMVYRFNTFILANHRPEALAQSDNIFAVVLEAAWSGLLKSPADAVLMEMKLATARRLLNKGYKVGKVRGIMNFIRFYVRFEKEENFPIFEKELDLMTQNRKAMGIEEAILQEVERQGIQKGIEKGIEKGRKEGIEKGSKDSIQTVIANGLKNGLSLPLLATLTGLSVEEVHAIAQSLGQDSSRS